MNYPYLDHVRVVKNTSDSHLTKFLRFVGFEGTDTLLTLAYDKPLDRVMACKESLLYQSYEFKEAKKMANSLNHFGLKRFQKYRKVMEIDLTAYTSFKERELLRLSSNDVEKLQNLSGQKTLAGYLTCIILDDTHFKNMPQFEELSQLSEEVSFLHKASFLIRQRFTDPVCRA
jgi:hypothetical protein